jgi:hypothetical protein
MCVVFYTRASLRPVHSGWQPQVCLPPPLLVKEWTFCASQLLQPASPAPPSGPYQPARQARDALKLF